MLHFIPEKRLYSEEAGAIQFWWKKSQFSHEMENKLI